jgi:hypothetical protein
MEPMKLRPIVAALLLAAILLAAGTTVHQTKALAAAVSGQSCVVRLASVQPGQQASAVLSYQCYASFPAAIAAATEGHVQISATTRPQDLTDALLNSKVSPNSLTVIAIEYKDINHGGAGLVVQADEGCSYADEYSYSGMPSGWNDVISSAQYFSGCEMGRHYENSNFGGALVACANPCNYVGNAMNDRTSSIKWGTS